MRVIGILGGMSWQSTALYYERMNRLIAAGLGGLHSAEVVIYSVDFAAIEALQHKGDWHAAGQIMAAASKKLTAAGAEAILLATNTMHKCVPDMAAATDVPILHIADATGAAIAASGLRRPLLLATAFTMEQDFYKGRLTDGFGLDPVIPNADDRQNIHRIIYDELCHGIITEESTNIYLDIIRRYSDDCDCVILGCTEITLLISDAVIADGRCPLPVFDTTQLHVQAAVDFALSGA